MAEEVTDAEYRECSRTVLDLYVPTRGQVRVPVEGTVKFQATFPLAMYALNQVQAALILAETRREYLATANVRVAYEHAVTAQWVLFTEAAETKLVGTANVHNRLVLEGMTAYADIPEDLLTAFGGNGDPQMPRFVDRCAALDGGSGSLLALYQSLSVAVHPSYATMMQHLTFGPKRNSVGVSFEATRAAPVDTWRGCALSAMAAAATIETQREHRPRIPQLVQLMERYRVPMDLRA